MKEGKREGKGKRYGKEEEGNGEEGAGERVEVWRERKEGRYG